MIEKGKTKDITRLAFGLLLPLSLMYMMYDTYQINIVIIMFIFSAMGFGFKNLYLRNAYILLIGFSLPIYAYLIAPYIPEEYLQNGDNTSLDAKFEDDI